MPDTSFGTFTKGGSMSSCSVPCPVHHFSTHAQLHNGRADTNKIPYQNGTHLRTVRCIVGIPQVGYGLCYKYT